MNSVAKIVDHAEQQCRNHGARLTEKRKHVLSGLLQSDKALSAYELIEVCKDQFGETLPPMSMYRILDFLRQERLVHRLNLANKYVACAHITCDHAHTASQFLICVQCQKVEEIQVSESVIDALESTIEQAGFRLATPQFEINCVCDRCVAAAA